MKKLVLLTDQERRGTPGHGVVGKDPGSLRRLEVEETGARGLAVLSHDGSIRLVDQVTDWLAGRISAGSGA